MRLEGRVALVTGGGSGIGRAIARASPRKVRASWSTTSTRTAPSAPPARSAVRPAASPPTWPTAPRYARCSRRSSEPSAALDVLVNNAGIAEVDAGDREAFRAKAETRIAEMMAGTVETHWDVTRTLSRRGVGSGCLPSTSTARSTARAEALRLMGRANRGAIVNISSVAGLMGIEVAPHYGAAKAGILGFTRSVAREVASRGIRVNAICPGWIDTPILDPLPPMVRMLAERADADGTPGRPREIAAVALFLASDDASFVTGQWLSPNGGLLTV